MPPRLPGEIAPAPPNKKTPCFLFLLWFGHFLPDGVQQAFGFEFIQSVAGGFEVVGQRLGQALIERSVFHVDDHGPVASTCDLLGESKGLLLRRQGANRNIPCPIGQDDEQWFHVWMDHLLLGEHFIGHQQTGRERRLATHRNVGQGALGQRDGIRRGQDKCGAVLLEDDQTDPVAALIGVRQQGQDGTLRGGHTLCHGHGPGSIHQKQDQVGGLLDAYLALQVTFLDGKSHLLALLDASFLEGCCRADGGIEGHIVGFAVGRAGLNVTASFALGVRARAAAGMLAG